MTAEATVKRIAGIGGSDISALLGVHPTKTQWDVFAEKTLLDIAIENTSRRMEWGKKLQRVIAEAYTEETGRAHVWLDETLPGKVPHQIWTPDALLPKDDRVLECKTAGVDRFGDWGEPGSSDVPPHYEAQAQWYLLASGYELADIALLMGGSDFRIYTIKADKDVQAAMAEVAERFWRLYIKPNVPPPIEDSPGAREWVRRRWPKNNGRMAEATALQKGIVEAYAEANAQLERAKEVRDTWSLRVKQAIGDFDGFTFNGRLLVTNRKAKDSAITDWESVALGLLPRIPVEDANTLVDLHTRVEPGSRRLLLKEKKESKNGQ